MKDKNIFTSTKLPWLLPISVWLAVVSWRPLVAGFYHDDWMVFLPIVKGSIRDVFRQQASRPLYATLVSLVRLALPMNPHYHHVMLILLIALSAGAMALFGARLSRLFGTGDLAASWAGAFAASTWIATPWDLGVSIWPTTFAAQISVAGFCMMGWILLGSDSDSVKAVKAFSVFVLVSLISELFWLSFIPLVLIMAFRSNKFLDWRKLKFPLLLTVGFCIIQAGLASFNRLLVYLGIGTNRSYNSVWIETTQLSMRLLPMEISKSVVSPAAFWTLAGLALLLALLCILFHPQWRSAIAVLIAIATGTVITIVLFAVASYRMESIGIFSRSTVVMSAWFSLFPALLLSISEIYSRWIRWGARSIAMLLVLILALSSINNVQGWARSWIHENAVLRAFPEKEMLNIADKDSVILLEAERPGDAVEGLEAFWDATGALYTTYPELGARLAPVHYRQFAMMTNTPRMQTIWNGKVVIQSFCTNPDTPLWSFDAPSNVYLWRYDDKKITRLAQPAKLGCPPHE